MLFRYSLSEPFIGVSGLIINYFDDRRKCILIIKDCGRILLRSVVFNLFQYSTYNNIDNITTLFDVYHEQHEYLTMEYELLIYLERRGKAQRSLTNSGRQLIMLI